jgi:hypothetical protein
MATSTGGHCVADAARSRSLARSVGLEQEVGEDVARVAVDVRMELANRPERVSVAWIAEVLCGVAAEQRHRFARAKTIPVFLERGGRGELVAADEHIDGLAEDSQFAVTRQLFAHQRPCNCIKAIPIGTLIEHQLRQHFLGVADCQPPVAPWSIRVQSERGAAVTYPLPVSWRGNQEDAFVMDQAFVGVSRHGVRKRLRSVEELNGVGIHRGHLLSGYDAQPSSVSSTINKIAERQSWKRPCLIE